MKCIHRTYLPTEGDILYDSLAYGKISLAHAAEREILYLRSHEIGYVSQFLSVMPRTTAKEHVMHALLETGWDGEQVKSRRNADLFPAAGKFVGYLPEYVFWWGTAAVKFGTYYGKASTADVVRRTDRLAG